MKGIASLGVLATMVLGCSVNRNFDTSCLDEKSAIQATLFTHMLSVYDNLPPQFDDPMGREYCLGVDFELGTTGRSADKSLLERFAHRLDIHELKWCDKRRGRLVSVGPIDCRGPKEAAVETFSWVWSRPSGAQCLLKVFHAEGTWRVSDGCLQGGVFN